MDTIFSELIGKIQTLESSFSRLESERANMIYDLAYVNETLAIEINNKYCFLIDSGRKIHAIKLYRALNNCGLREAKEAIENMQLNRDLE